MYVLVLRRTERPRTARLHSRPRCSVGSPQVDNSLLHNPRAGVPQLRCCADLRLLPLCGEYHGVHLLPVLRRRSAPAWAVQQRTVRGLLASTNAVVHADSHCDSRVNIFALLFTDTNVYAYPRSLGDEYASIQCLVQLLLLAGARHCDQYHCAGVGRWRLQHPDAPQGWQRGVRRRRCVRDTWRNAHCQRRCLQ